ncbi:GNAT family N-acetyltransferase [Pseudooceanicola nanhaiensis]|uniref:GNAT family N-acetyltransferase n=1 Tax=Pseudooceanicola nanhaiensis TaxID=375761 RepID=UPI001CD557B1|nr:GNAT family N-acetyltransferase [Pseudooceanicola nanhaiensis]MCA0918967.1 GNAT family N-acetyltransferase [Pseudooceanicola nanhaiensis]
MTPEDLARIHGASFVMPAPWPARDFADFLASPLCFVETDGAAGFILGRVIADEAELLTIAVAPTARRQGSGARLLAAFEATARTRGAATAFLEVAVTNEAARGLYTGAGWQLTGRRRGYYHTPQGDPVDAEILSKQLT